jgi:tetratricopeptide (TPR) repeat protein
MFADLGIVGGLLFAGMFVMILVFSLQVWFKDAFEKYRLSTTILLMAVACYAIDAFFNFPAERPAMQVMLSLSAALVFVPYLLISESEKRTASKSFAPAIIVVGLFLMSGAIYIAQQTYASLKVQKYVMGEIDSDPKMALDEVKDAFPSIPNLSTSTLPIPALVARYHFRDKQYDEALRLLKESDQVNPDLHYNDFIRTAIYGAKNNYDSTFYFAHRAFYNWPRATSYYKNMIFASAKKQDTVEIKKAFELYKKYRDGAEAWNQYLLAMYEVKKGVDPRLKLQLDSIVKKYPGDSALLSKVVGLYNSNASVVAIVNNAVNYTEEGAKAFMAKNYQKAASFYLKAAQQDPNNYTHYENVAISYYTMQNFPKAIEYFSKAKSYPSEQTGKSEFFIAMCYIAQGKGNMSCDPLNKAKKKGYPGVDQFLQQYCK